MGNQQSTNLNDIQAILNSVIRSTTGKNEIDSNLEESLDLLVHEIGDSTVKSNAESLKLQSLSQLIKYDDVQKLKKAIEEGKYSVTDPLGHLQLTPLHLAAYHQSFKILKYLLSLTQVPVNSLNKDGQTPLNVGLLTAETDASASELIRYFLCRKDLNICIKSSKSIFPLLITAARRFSGASKFLLTSLQKSANNIIDQYDVWDLVEVIKLGLITNQDSLINLINQNLNARRRLEVIEEIRRIAKSQDDSDFLDGLVTLLEKTSVEGTTSGSGSTTQQEYSNLDRTLVVNSSNTTVEAPEPDTFSTVDDAGGVELKVGNIVKTLSVYNVKKGLPPNAKESDVFRLSEKLATIHEITGNKIYVEIHGEQCVARMKAEVTIFSDDGPSKVIGDGSLGRIGSFVQVLSKEAEVRKLPGKLGWIHGMEDTCGRTGRVVRILSNSDMLVQFAWGTRFYFKPDALLQSSSDRVDTQDYKNKWLSIGNLVQIRKFRTDFLAIQKNNNLPVDGSYAELPWKYAVVKAIRIKAFSTSKTVKISYKGAPYFVHVESIELVDTVKDSKDNDLRQGSQVKVLEDEASLKSLQEGKREFGGWADDMSEVVDEVGKVTAVCIDERGGSKPTDLMTKVVFEDSTAYYFNPRAIQVYTGTVVTKLRPTVGRSKEKPQSVEDDKWEQIDRSNLACFEILGEGGFGCVVRGEWNKNGNVKVVAIKKVKVGVTSGAGPMDDVLKEAKIQFSMRHPNIVSLFGISVAKDLWIVMDLVDGTDLYTMLFPGDDKQVIVIPFKEKLKLCTDMSNAIAYIHQKRYLHCDIKPHNMMVDRKTRNLYVCDFGITKFLGSMDYMSFATQYTNSVSGTLYYISPECLQPDGITGKYRKPTFAADIWALGAVFYELFAQMHLYDHHMKFLQDKLINNDSLVKRRMDDLPKEVRPIVSRALNFTYGARPTAQELSEFFHELH